MGTPAGRPENPLPADAPASLLRLAGRLRQLRLESRLSYAELAAKANYSVPALSQAASAKKLPSWSVTEAYALACGITDDDGLADLKVLWTAASEEAKLAKKLRRTRQRTQGRPASRGDDELGPAYGDVDLSAITDLREYADALAKVRDDAGLTVREIIEHSQTIEKVRKDESDGKVVQLKRSTVYDVLKKNVRPSPAFTTLYLRACGLTNGQIDRWIECLMSVSDAQLRVAAAYKALIRPKGGLGPDEGTPISTYNADFTDFDDSLIEIRPLLSHEAAAPLSLSLIQLKQRVMTEPASTADIISTPTWSGTASASAAAEVETVSDQVGETSDTIAEKTAAVLELEPAKETTEISSVALVPPKPRTHRPGVPDRPSYGRPTRPAIQLQWPGRDGPVRLTIDRSVLSFAIILCTLITILVVVWLLAG